MELIAELLLQIAGFVLELLFELGLQVAFELIAEALSRRTGGRLRARELGPWIAGFGYAALGAAFGVVSLLVFPELFVRGTLARWVNLLVTPLLCGVIMAALGAWMERHDRRRVRLDGFLFGALFAFAMSAVRLVFGR